ncbi:hypothetical protein QBZ16_001726 [Prototheca wickerhamii]|uniref:Ubiquitin receptor RAD23 n=1 Tax=Prototheca wickerhamii TaxID=3111 RepID=A0AAD9MK28_PROWI|nr:hypothetical protein QBZ16_001726 [Prototheca wickerhamii]
MKLTIKDVKEGIQAAHADLPADSLNVIYQGKILKDDATLAESNVLETGFVVVMVIKPPSAYASAASQLATGSELERQVAAIMEMGFPQEEVQRAMRAAFNNPERAGLGAEPAAPAAEAAPPAPGAPPAGAAAPFDMFAPGRRRRRRRAPPAAGPLDFLRSNPQFQMLRAMVQQNPALLEPMLQELGRSNPALLEQINAHQAEFLAMINEPAPEGATDLQSLVRQLASQYGEEGAAAALMEQDEPGAGEPGVVEVHLSEEEVAAVERLIALGFGRQQCLEAFLICDRDESLAANYLLERGHEEEDDQ